MPHPNENQFDVAHAKREQLDRKFIIRRRKTIRASTERLRLNPPIRIHTLLGKDLDAQKDFFSTKGPEFVFPDLGIGDVNNLTRREQIRVRDLPRRDQIAFRNVREARADFHTARQVRRRASLLGRAESTQSTVLG